MSKKKEKKTWIAIKMSPSRGGVCYLLEPKIQKWLDDVRKLYKIIGLACSVGSWDCDYDWLLIVYWYSREKRSCRGLMHQLGTYVGKKLAVEVTMALCEQSKSANILKIFKYIFLLERENWCRLWM